MGGDKEVDVIGHDFLSVHDEPFEWLPPVYRGTQELKDTTYGGDVIPG